MVTGMLKSPLGTAAMSSWEQRQFCQQCSNLRTSLVFLQLASISFCSWPPYISAVGLHTFLQLASLQLASIPFCSWPPYLSAVGLPTVGLHTFLQLASIPFCSWPPYSWPPYLSAVGLHIRIKACSLSELPGLVVAVLPLDC